MIVRVALLDELTPAVAAWIADINPGAKRALIKAGTLIRRRALQNIQATFRRTGENRTELGTPGKKARRSGVRGGAAMRGLRMRFDVSATIPSVRVWHGSGILAAHELGSTIPPATLKPDTRRVLGWGGPPGGKQTEFSRGHRRRAFTLPRRPTLIPAYEANATAVLELIENEYEKVLNPPSVTVRVVRT